MYRFKLKEIEVGDTKIRKGVKSTVTDIDPETGAISWDVVDAADFSSVYKALSKAKDFLDTLEKEGKAKDDTVIDGFAEDIAKLFNAFRTHVRKNYPKEYERVSRLKEDLQLDIDLYNQENPGIFSKADEKVQVTIPGKFGDNEGDIALQKALAKLGKKYTSYKVKDVKELKEEEVDEGEGIGYLTPKAFDKNKKSTGAPSIYYYKLGYKPVPKKIKGAGTIVKQLFEYSNFQQKRIAVFDEVENKINNILPMLSNAKNETAEFYNENPGSYAIVVPTDYILEILDEVELKLKQVQDK